MEKHLANEKSISTEDILETLDRFGARSKTPSPVQDGDHHSRGTNITSQRPLSVEDPLSSQRLSLISADGSEIDSDYSSASSVIYVSDEQRNLEREWQMLFGSTAYYAKIRQHALEGKLRFSKFRSICWKVFMECLPEQKEHWILKATQLRKEYHEFKTKCLFDPNKAKNRALDLSVFNPLSQDESSPWKQYFQDNELKSTIKQDLDRLFPEIEFFQQSKVKEMMLCILFCHAKKNEALSYKQGMHELLAPIIYVLNEDVKIFEHLEGPSLDIARFLMDPKYLEHDAFALFVQLMDQTETWYLQLPIRGFPERNKLLDPHAEPFTDQDMMPCTAIVKKLSRIHEHMLRKHDPELWIHMKNLDITPQVYGLRWIRLLFGREFPMEDVLVLWDALFADGPMLDLVDYIYISMLGAIRDKLLVGSYSACMGYLMKFPRAYDDVHRYVRCALTTRQNKTAAARSSPRPSRPPAPRPVDSSGTFPQRKKQGVKRPQSAFTSFTKRYQQFIEPTKQATPKATNKVPTEDAPKINSVTEEELIPKGSRPGRPVSVPAPDMRERADSGSQSSSSPVKAMKSITNPLKGKLMTRPRTRSKASYDELAQDHERLQHQVSSLKSELDKLQGLYLYCGRKMDSYIDVLQDELASDENCVQDVVYLCLAGLKQVRDLLKGTLAFRGSTMEHECDFMEIDNNIAARLQVPSMHQMQFDNLPASIPVPMLANFSHFENQSEENESSFMTSTADGESREESREESHQDSADLKDQLSASTREGDKVSDNIPRHSVEDAETTSAEDSSFEKRDSSEVKAEEGMREQFLSFDEETSSSRALIDLNPQNLLFFEETEGAGDMFDNNPGLSDDVERRTEEKSVQPQASSQPLAGYGQKGEAPKANGEVTTAFDPVANLSAEFGVKVQLHSSHPLEGGDSLSDSQGSWTSEIVSPERDFVFVNRDGTAMSLPRPPRHPLDNTPDEELADNKLW